MTTFYQKIKQNLGLLASLLCLCTQVTWLQAQAPNTWEQKSNLPPSDVNGPGARTYAVGFSIGNKGYIGTGYDNTNTPTSDFWEYDPATNSWTQKADFGGTARFAAVGFGIGSKGYLGTGYDYVSYNFTKDFWEYDPAANNWTKKADFGGEARYMAVGFSIGSKGYLGTGYNNSGNYNDFWEYDPTDGPDGKWTQKANFGGTARLAAVGFNIGNKGYLGTGRSFDINGNDIYCNDFWEYDPATDSWVQKADVGGEVRAYAVGFGVGGKGYIGTGVDGNQQPTKDFWEYNPDTNSWIKKANVGGGERHSAVGFGIGSKGYIGTGYTLMGTAKDFWEYDPSANNWTKKAEQLIADNLKRYYAVGFSIGNKGYIGTGFDNTNQHTNDFWEYDPSTNTWTKKADFGGVGRYDAVGFSIGSKGYIGTGMVDYWNYITTNDFWEYDPSNDTWTKKADFGGGERHVAVGFGIGSKGYMGTGASRTQGIMEDFWEYNPSTNSWTKKANFGGGYLGYALGFSMGGKGYVGTGTDISYGYTKAFWEYNPTDGPDGKWTQKADFGGTARGYAVGFGIGNKGYIGTGNDYGHTNDFWEYTPEPSCNLSASIAPNTLQTICAGATLALSGSSTGGTAPTYSWGAGGGAFESNQQNPSFTAPSVGSTTNYTVTLTASENRCSATATVGVQVNPSITVGVSFEPICLVGNPLNLSASGGSSYNWKGPNGFKSNIANPTKAKTVAKDEGIYSVTVTGNGVCTVTSTIRVYYGIGAGEISITNRSPYCKGGPISLTATATGASSYSWSKQFGTTTFTGNPVTITTNAKTSDGGVYMVFVRGQNGCVEKQETLVSVSPVACIGTRMASEEAEEIDMQINAYPNPVANTLTVEVTLQKPSKLSLKLFNSIGKESGTWLLNEEVTFHKTELNMSDLTGGVYLLQGQVGKQKVVKRVVKIQY